MDMETEAISDVSDKYKEPMQAWLIPDFYPLTLKRHSLFF